MLGEGTLFSKMRGGTFAVPQLIKRRSYYRRFKYREKNAHDPGDDKRISEVGMEEGIFTMRALFYLVSGGSHPVAWLGWVGVGWVGG